MKHIGLFAGIGGFELAAEWMGWETIAWCENNPFCQTVLKYHFPKAIGHGDIKTTDFSIYRGLCDIVTGGFPCQPFSVAGLQLGTNDERYLWKENLRAIREIQPPYVVAENVRGLVGWNEGLVFEQVQTDLENEGYEVQSFLLPACGVDAPHLRYRIWFVAYSYCNEARRCGYGKIGSAKGIGEGKKEERQRLWSNAERIDEKENVANACRPGCQELNIPGFAAKPGNGTGISNEELDTNTKKQSKRTGVQAGREERAWRGLDNFHQPCNWSDLPTQSPVCDGNDGFPTQSLRQYFREDSNGIISEKEIDKILSEAFTGWRNDSIKGGGNAIVPQVAYQILKAIEQYELVKQPQ